jgi:hypothetical protein
LAIDWARMRSRVGGTSARPVGGTGCVRIRGHQRIRRVVPARDLERRAPDEELPEGRGQRVDVTALGELGSRRGAVGLEVEDLGRRPRHGDADVGCIRAVAGGGPVERGYRVHTPAAGDAEVGQPRRAVAADEDVGRLDVVVDDAGLVGGLDGAGQLDAGTQHLVNGQRREPGPAGEVRRRVVLHDEVRAAVRRGAAAEDLDDVGVVAERRHGVRLLGELASYGVGEAFGSQDLDRHRHPGRLLLVEVDVGVPAGPERLHVDQARQLWGAGGLQPAHARASLGTS